MKVSVKWVTSPRVKFGIPRAPGTFSSLEVSVARRIIKESPGIFISPELDEANKPKEKPIKVKDTAVKKTRTRPVKR